MDIYKPGSEVKFVDSGLTGIVNCACLYAHGGILYEIAYWQGGDRKTCWVNPQEIMSGEEKKKVGFR